MSPAQDLDISDRVRFEAQVLEAVRDSVIFTDLEGRIRYWNRGAEEVFGYSAEEMIGETPALLYPTANPEELSGDLRAIMAGRNYVGTWEGRRKDGRSVWVDVKTTMVLDAQGEPIGFLGLAKDATDRKLAEDALAESERRYRLVSQASREALWEWDLQTGQVKWSAGAETILGFAPERVTQDGALAPEHVHPEDRARVESELMAAVAGGTAYWSDEYRIRRRDGTYAIVSDRAYIERDGDDRPIRVIGALADITERRQAEERYRQVDRLEAVGRLAGGMAHDLNNMLMSILGSADFLAKSLDPESAAMRDLQRITLAANRSAKLTQQLLAFARRDMVQARTLDLNLTVTQAASLLRPLLRRSVDLDLRLGTDIGHVFADRSRIEQLVVNLVLNARDAMPEGGIVTVETASVVLDRAYMESHGQVIGQPGKYILLAVSDTGHGMNAETLSHIFEPFYTTKPVGEGTGLGLATVYGSVKQAGGLVWAYSEPGMGTVVKVYLPEIGSERGSSPPAATVTDQIG
jgi:PAS domain S-box-containing protein